MNRIYDHRDISYHIAHKIIDKPWRDIKAVTDVHELVDTIDEWIPIHKEIVDVIKEDIKIEFNG